MSDYICNNCGDDIDDHTLEQLQICDLQRKLKNLREVS
jgi:hypothetical protein